MPEPMDAQHFAGPHPTCREFVAQLTVWGFTPRGEEGVHTVFRGPRGGTLRVIRSQLGRADPALVEKAARLAGVTPAQFWSGPQPQAAPAPPPDTARAGRGLPAQARGPRQRHLPRPGDTRRSGPAARLRPGCRAVRQPGDPRPGEHGQLRALPRRPARPDQVRGVPVVSRPARRRPAGPRTPPPRRHPPPAGSPAPGAGPGPQPASPRRISAAELFSQLFPSGVQMTGELLADLEQWARLTSKLAAQGGRTAP